MASPLVAVPPSSKTTSIETKTPLKPLFCDEASPFLWNEGNVPDANVTDVAELLKRPGVTISQVRELVGDTDATVLQAKKINATGVKLCGWKGTTK